MKTLYITMLAAFITATSFGQNGQIQNRSFENWSNIDLYEIPDVWLSQPSDDWNGVAAVTKSSDASDGAFSCELTVKEVGAMPDTTFGYVLHGAIGNMGPSGGIAYTDAFDEVTFDYKSDLPAGDTLYLLAVRYDGVGGSTMYLIPAAYGTHSTWTNGSIPMSATPQTELFIGFVIGNPLGNGPKPTPNVWAKVDNVVLKNGGSATTNLPNYSFENWTTVSTEEADHWFTRNEDLAGEGLENVIKTTDAYSGMYAMQLSTIYYPKWEDTVTGVVSIGEIDFGAPSNQLGLAPYNASPTTFEYAYKYTGANGDLSASLYFEFFNSGSNIGGGFVTITDQSSYFMGSMAVSLSGTPDSVRVAAFSGDSLGSVLKLDDLAFTGGNVGVDEFSKLSMDVYPNPANDYVMIKSENEYEIEILDVTGKMVYNSKNNSGIVTINTEEYNKGAYFIKINSNQKTQTQKLIIQ